MPERLYKLDVDLTGSNCGEGWYSVRLLMSEHPDLRGLAAAFYAVPLSQVSEPVPTTLEEYEMEAYVDD